MISSSRSPEYMYMTQSSAQRKNTNISIYFVKRVDRWRLHVYNSLNNQATGHVKQYDRCQSKRLDHWHMHRIRQIVPHNAIIAIETDTCPQKSATNTTHIAAYLHSCGVSRYQTSFVAKNSFAKNNCFFPLSHLNLACGPHLISIANDASQNLVFQTSTSIDSVLCYPEITTYLQPYFTETYYYI